MRNHEVRTWPGWHSGGRGRAKRAPGARGLRAHFVRPQPPQSRPHAHRGFTLLEVLLATIMVAVLLMALWSLFRIYTDLFETGQAKVETSQLARALLEQLTDDLHSAIQDPIPGAPAETRTSAPLRRFVFSGTENQLRLDVLQVTPLQGNPEPVSDSERIFRESSAARVPELRTVFYDFQAPLASAPSLEPAESLGTGAAALPGLFRRELDFETPVTDRSGSNLASQPPGLGSSASGILSEEPQPVSGGTGRAAADVLDTSIIWVPEVVRLEFRYFDGNSWSSQWSSLTRKALPVAVEVLLQLRTPTEPAAAAETGTGAEAPASQTVGQAGELALEPALEEGGGLDGLGAEVDRGQGPELLGPVYRLVIDIPGSPQHKAPEKVQPVSLRRAAPAPRPLPRRIAPVRLPLLPAEPTQRPLADEWMRAES